MKIRGKLRGEHAVEKEKEEEKRREAFGSRMAIIYADLGKEQIKVIWWFDELNRYGS